MLGYSHATSGALVWLLAAPPTASLLNQPLGPKELAAGAVACAGAALIPDLDHPKATIANTFGPVSESVSRGVALLAGGHRQATHSLAFVVGFGLLCQAFALGGSTWALIMMFLLAAFAFRALNIVIPGTSYSLKGIVVLLEAAGVTLLIAKYTPGSWWWFGFAAALGCLVHLVGDTLTPEGVPWFWPSRWRGSLPLIAHTGNTMEKAIIGPAMTVALIFLIWLDFVKPWLSEGDFLGG